MKKSFKYLLSLILVCICFISSVLTVSAETRWCIFGPSMLYNYTTNKWEFSWHVEPNYNSSNPWINGTLKFKYWSDENRTNTLYTSPDLSWGTEKVTSEIYYLDEYTFQSCSKVEDESYVTVEPYLYSSLSSMKMNSRYNYNTTNFEGYFKSCYAFKVYYYSVGGALDNSIIDWVKLTYPKSITYWVDNNPNVTTSVPSGATSKNFNSTEGTEPYFGYRYIVDGNPLSKGKYLHCVYYHPTGAVQGSVCELDIKTASFSSSKATVPDSIQRYRGQYYYLPDGCKTTPSDLTFEGWSTEGEKVLSQGETYNKLVYPGVTSLSADVTYYPVWREMTYNVSYNNNYNNTTVATNTYKKGEEFNIHSAITRTDYKFKGWNTASNGTGTSYSAGSKVKDIGSPGNTVTLYAQWEKATYTVKYNNNYNDTVIETNTYQVGQEFNIYSEISREGYKFNGWNKASNGSSTSYSANTKVKDIGSADSTVTLYAQWVPIKYEVRVFPNKPSDASSVIQKLK